MGRRDTAGNRPALAVKSWVFRISINITQIISQLEPHSRPQLTDDEYWEECQNLSVEIEDAISIFHTHEEINRPALESPAVVNMQTHCSGMQSQKQSCTNYFNSRTEPRSVKF
jgi:hypothetical protein